MIDTIFFAQGALGLLEKQTANLTVLASDDPYGVFIVSANNRPVVTPSAFIGDFISFHDCFCHCSFQLTNGVIFHLIPVFPQQINLPLI